MKPVLAWIKSNVLVVVFSAIVLVILPTAWFVSAAWSKKIRTKQETDAGRQLQAIQGARVDYSLQQFEPTVERVTFKAEPNALITEWFKRERDRLAGLAGDVVKRAVDFNKGVGPDAESVGRKEHKPLVEGLFPTAGDREVEKLNEFEDKILAKRGNASPYQQLLDSIRAGGPADPRRLSVAIQDLNVRETEKITAGKRDLTPDERQKLTKQLTDRRMAEYNARAKAISLYADITSFPSDAKFGSAIPIGRIPDPRMINPVTFFIYQWDLWALSDLFSAVRLANTDAGGKPTDIENSSVKRIISMTLADPDGLFGNTEESERRRELEVTGQIVATPSAAVPGLVPLDPTLSITGRGMGPWNTVFDVRRATMTVVVSSARLQDFLNAISRANFMTVTDLDLDEVDVWADLRDGYYYGNEHVVKATVGIETVWLRAWMAPLMPPKLGNVLGVPAPAPADPAAAPAASPGAG